MQKNDQNKLNKKNPNYLIGIDLGTTNIAVSFCQYNQKTETYSEIESFKIPQIIAPGQIAELHLLPAYYLDLTATNFDEDLALLPFQTEKAIIGYFAKELTESYQNNVISSVKSYLSHLVMDIDSPFLPLAEKNEKNKHSPIEITSAFLKFIKDAWNEKYHRCDDLFENQKITITIPASFDEIARQATLKAAQLAGLLNIQLLEEPIAAFYHWLNTHDIEGETAKETHTELALVVDIGGGTSDFSLISLTLTPKGPELKRLATGEHLLLGGDNMDYFLLNLIHQKEKLKFSAKAYQSQLKQIQKAKEKLLTPDKDNKIPQKINFSLSDSSRNLFKSAKTATLEQNDIKKLIEGFFAITKFQSDEKEKPSSGLRHFGLPFESNANILYHIAYFLNKHQKDIQKELKLNSENIILPDVILFNGGLFHSSIFADIILNAIQLWAYELKIDKTIDVLFNSAPSLAVSYGATFFLQSRHKKGLKITSNTTKNYLIQISDDHAICILPKDAKVNEEFILNQSLTLKSNSITRLPLFSKSDNFHQSGDLISLNNSQLKPLSTIINKNNLKNDQKVTVITSLSEAGTIELKAKTNDHHTFPFEFNLNHKKNNLHQNALKNNPKKAIDLTKFKYLTECLNTFFKDKRIQINDIKNKLLKISGPIEKYNIGLGRKLIDYLFEVKNSRFKRAQTEQFFFFLIGKLLAPGFGFLDDQKRMETFEELSNHGLEYQNQTQNIQQYIICLRRLAPSLSLNLQNKLYDQLSPILLTRKTQLSKKLLIAFDEKVRLLASLEKLSLEKRILLAENLKDAVIKNPDSLVFWWALARLLNRIPLSENPAELVPAETVESILLELIKFKFNRQNYAFIAQSILLMTRKIESVEYKFSDEFIEAIEKRLKYLKADKDHMSQLTEIKEFDQQTLQYLYQNDLPLGLIL